MPLRFARPYIPRMYPMRPLAQGRPSAAATGTVAGDIVKAINNTIQQNRQNAIANQILNTQTAPRAGLVSAGVNPQTGAANVIAPGVATGGTPPQTGGLGELQTRQQLAQQGLADQLQQAKIQAQLALVRQRLGGGGGAGGGRGGGMAGSASRWKQALGGGGQGGGAGGGAQAGKPGKGVPYQAGTSDPQDPASDDFSKIRADFDQQYGKGMFDKFQANYANLTPDPKGNYSITDKDGNPVATVPPGDAAFWQNRVNAARVGRGQGIIGQLPAGINPQSGQPSGSQVNPIAPQDNLSLRALPYGTWIQGPDGSIKQKQPLAPPGTASTDQTGGAGAQPQVAQDQTGAGAQPQVAQAQGGGAGALPQLSQAQPVNPALGFMGNQGSIPYAQYLAGMQGGNVAPTAQVPPEQMTGTQGAIASAQPWSQPEDLYS